MINDWFIISGVHRSGTTLLRLCLDTHPNIETLDEPQSYPFLNRKNFYFDINNVNENFTKETATIGGFKVPGFSGVLSQWRTQWGNPKIIFSLRDSRQVVSSMKNFNSSLIAREAGIVLSRNINNPTFNTQWGTVINNAEEISDSQERIIALATLSWTIKVTEFLDLQNQYPQSIIGLNYNNLVLIPEITLRGACKFLNVEWNSDVLHPELQEHSGFNPNTGLFPGGTDGDRPIDTNSLGLWETNLSSTEKQIIDDFSQNLNSTISNILYTE